MIVIRGGEVLTEVGWVRADVAVEKGTVAAVATDLRGDVEIDATGCLVGPGFVDMHTHLREPGQTWKEDIASASSAAAAGGFTAFTAMPNTDPPMDSTKVIEAVLARAEEVGEVQLVPAGALTEGRAGAVLADIAALYRAGARIFSDDGDSLDDSSLMASAMEVISNLPGAFVAQHAEDHGQTAGGQMHDGAMARKLGVRGLPEQAEADIVERDLALVARIGARYHCQHVSAKMTTELIREAKKSGLPVSAEVAPHHLSFDESCLEGLDPDYKMYPPLRAAVDREALIEALADGTIDVVATDHAPHLPDEKAVSFDLAPRGVIGLETAASATWEALGDRDRLFSALSSTPASLLGLPDQGGPITSGSVANLVVFDPSSRWRPGRFRSKSSNSPYKDRELQGVVRATLYRGRISHRAGSEDL